MKKSSKKLIAPIIIAVLLVSYFIIFLTFPLFMGIPLIAKVVGIIVPLSLIGVSIFVLVERIKEIRSGEEDDLSKY